MLAVYNEPYCPTLPCRLVRVHEKAKTG